MNPWQFIPAFFIGLLLGYIYLRTRSLLPVIFVHVINNSFSYVTVYIFGEDVLSYRDLFAETGPYLILLAISAVIMAGCLFWLVRTIGEAYPVNPENKT